MQYLDPTSTKRNAMIMHFIKRIEYYYQFQVLLCQRLCNLNREACFEDVHEGKAQKSLGTRICHWKFNMGVIKVCLSCLSTKDHCLNDVEATGAMKESQSIR